MHSVVRTKESLCDISIVLIKTQDDLAPGGLNIEGWLVQGKDTFPHFVGNFKLK
jgi:hypothetical protein